MEDEACYMSSEYIHPQSKMLPCLLADCFSVPKKATQHCNPIFSGGEKEREKKKKALVTQHFSLNKSFLMTSNKSSCNHIPLPLKLVKVYLSQLKY